MKQIKNILVVCKHSQNSKEAKECHLLHNNGFKVNYSWKNTLSPNELKNTDLVIAIGGDGTALSASHFLKDIPLLAVNSAPNKSEGALTTLSIKELNKKLEEIKSGNYQIEKLERIEVYINNKLQNPLALNEVFTANKNAYKMSKYKIKIKQGDKIISERQKSSGVIFSTGTGSTAWFKSAGGEPFSPQEKFIKMLVREPFIGNLNKFQLIKAIINENDYIEIRPLTRMVLAIDSIREFKLTPINKVRIKISNFPLLRIK